MQQTRWGNHSEDTTPPEHALPPEPTLSPTLANTDLPPTPTDSPEHPGIDLEDPGINPEDLPFEEPEPWDEEPESRSLDYWACEVPPFYTGEPSTEDHADSIDNQPIPHEEEMEMIALLNKLVKASFKGHGKTR
ncbi:hypothetical protein FRC08_016930 [Ceratobasidium sp. 394]|nr:hypothetical protein FRC08_016930 [Ceratobasidium sp. 394]KAG9094040.1 hypothetical protein FS749_013237 [Ceratobasidium sp. UAMH 11750]